MVFNGVLIFYLYVLVFETYWGSIGYLQIHSSGLLVFEFYGGPTDPVKCIVEEGVSNSRSGDK